MKLKVFFLCSDGPEPFSESEILFALFSITPHPTYDEAQYLKAYKWPNIKQDGSCG